MVPSDDRGQTSHYSPALQPSVMLRHVSNMAEGFTCWVKERGVDPEEILLCWSGMSGTAYGTALLMELVRSHNVRVNAAYVRKTDEHSHGGRVEYGTVAGKDLYQTNAVSIIVFVDDFVATGATLRRCRKVLEEKWPSLSGATWFKFTGRDRPYGGNEVSPATMPESAEAELAKVVEGEEA